LSKSNINRKTFVVGIAPQQSNGVEISNEMFPAHSVVLRCNMDDLYREMENVKDTLVLVEGPNDKRSLEKLGFQNVVFMNKPLYKIVESLEDQDEVLLLTDLDQHGKGLYKYFYQELTKRGVRVNNRLRILLMQTPVLHIEGLFNYLQRKEYGAMME
jgi:5S rRNA maturation endonuclease (ribonuclease M5)